ncbi:MAG: ATP synthase subunit I [Gammaproteobacteria bacterium]|nr:ATP synthase subunit I [Gammaproteobacteria bacterium]
MLQPYRKAAWQLIIWQFVLIMLIAFLWLLFSDNSTTNFISTILGGVAVILPTSYFIWQVFYKKVASPRALLVRFLLAEIIKLISSAILLVAFIHYLHLSLLPSISSFMIAYLATIGLVARL